jgi:hypothetical protein
VLICMFLIALLASAIGSPICQFVRVRNAGGEGYFVNGMYALEQNQNHTHAWTFRADGNWLRLYTDDSWNWWLENAATREVIYRAWGYVLPDDAWMPAQGDTKFLPAPSMICDYSSECTLASTLGCYSDSPPHPHLLSGYFESCKLPNCRMTMEYCFSRCNSRGWKLAGLQSGTNCMCGDALPSWAVKDPAGLDKCSSPCAGDASETCGGASNVQVASFSCLGPALNQGSSAVIAKCTDRASQQWTVGGGGSICLVNSSTACLNAFVRKEHASIIVGGNHTPWGLNTATPQKPNCPSASGQGCAACSSIVDERCPSQWCAQACVWTNKPIGLGHGNHDCWPANWWAGPEGHGADFPGVSCTGNAAGCARACSAPAHDLSSLFLPAATPRASPNPTPAVHVSLTPEQQLVIAADCGQPGASGPEAGDDCGQVDLTPLVLAPTSNNGVRGGDWSFENDRTIRSTLAPHLCITADCFVWGKGIGLDGEYACATFGKVASAQACQHRCQEVDCCSWWVYHKDTQSCSLKYDKGFEWGDGDARVSYGPKYCGNEPKHAAGCPQSYVPGVSWIHAFGSCWLAAGSINPGGGVYTLGYNQAKIACGANSGVLPHIMNR